LAELLLDVKNYLVAQIGSLTSAMVFRDYSPADGILVVVLQEYQGAPATLGETVAHRSVQVTARSKDLVIAKNMAWAMYRALQEPETLKVQFTVGRWGLVYLRQTPYKMRIDEFGRVVYGFNMGVTTAND